jgi:hypothetical protein
MRTVYRVCVHSYRIRWQRKAVGLTTGKRGFQKRRLKSILMRSSQEELALECRIDTWLRHLAQTESRYPSRQERNPLRVVIGTTALFPPRRARRRAQTLMPLRRVARLQPFLPSRVRRALPRYYSGPWLGCTQICCAQQSFIQQQSAWGSDTVKLPLILVLTWQAWTCSSLKTYYWQQLFKLDGESSFNLLRWNIAFSCTVHVMAGIYPTLPSTTSECSTVPLTYMCEWNSSRVF